MTSPAQIDALLYDLIGRRLGHTSECWPRKLYDFVERSARSLGQSPGAWLENLRRSSPEGPEIQSLLAAATIGHTSFFRHSEQFSELRKVLRTWSDDHRADPLQIWSVGCSTGEEAYSLALCAQELSIRTRIFATDINSEALKVARVGRYARGPFDPPGASGEWTAPADLKRAIRFESASLVTDDLPADEGPFDLVFCRNVLIYFPRHDVPAVLERLAAELKPGGSIVVSPTDAVLPIPDCLRRGDAPGWLHATHQLPPSGRAPLSVRLAAARAPESNLRPNLEPPAAEAQSPIDRAALLLGSGRGPEAEALLTEVLNSRDDDIGGWFLLGEALLQRGESTQARAAFIRASRCTATESSGIDGSALRWAAARRAEALLGE